MQGLSLSIKPAYLGNTHRPVDEIRDRQRTGLWFHVENFCVNSNQVLTFNTVTIPTQTALSHPTK